MATTTAHREHPNYLAVGLWLTVLTVIEIAVAFLPIVQYVISILLVGLAVSKAAIVASYFMHLKFERRTLAIIAITPILICVLLVFALIPDLSAIPLRSATATSQQAPTPSH